MNKLREYYLIIEEIEDKLNELPIINDEKFKDFYNEIYNRIKAQKKLMLEKIAIEESKRGGKNDNKRRVSRN